ncbi:MAG TPA: type II toxin-antitoxin system RelE/ParE family toxin [Chitinophagaceae bacterium]
MENSIIYLPRALKEFDESFEFYEERTVGLGVRFEDQLKEKLEIISQYPERYRRRQGKFREALIKEFPFLVIYKYYKTKNIILISSIFHTSRNPENKYRK